MSFAWLKLNPRLIYLLQGLTLLTMVALLLMGVVVVGTPIPPQLAETLSLQANTPTVVEVVVMVSPTIALAPPAKSVALLTTSQTPADENWYVDSGATHHLTANLANLNVHADEYHGQEQIRVGNGNSLPIKHVGTTQLLSLTSSFHLNDVLHVPISQNLLSIQKFTTDTNTFVELHPKLFNVKDEATGRTLLHSPSKNGLYPFPLFINKHHQLNKTPYSPTTFVGERVSHPHWHFRLGHPALCTVSRIISHFGLPARSRTASPLNSAPVYHASWAVTPIHTEPILEPVNEPITHSPLENTHEHNHQPHPIHASNPETEFPPKTSQPPETSFALHLSHPSPHPWLPDQRTTSSNQKSPLMAQSDTHYPRHFLPLLMALPPHLSSPVSQWLPRAMNGGKP
uniref:Retrovirus-related Pol polyprotein from transposon TNT 1-94-like beta-barrel domain-containing protein n=1 Tax=Fagus sylvatica TaxID=28930 RepID=A0A2N9I1P4_FAGSY